MTTHTRWDRVGPFLTAPHVVLYCFLAFAVLAGIWTLNQRAEQNCAAQVYSLRVILHELPPSDDPGVQETLDRLNRIYAMQYARIYKFLDGESCVDRLPENAPPTPTVPKR